jgi:HTH-type transcriptional regulator, sugar sensing transcriptional regulator
MAFSETGISTLMDLGLNRLEAMVYLALIREPGSTGYRIGRVTGKAVPNVYQALESLARKGAAIRHEAQKERRYSAVPIREMIARFRSDLEAKAETLENELSESGVTTPGDGIYRIDNEAQLFTRIGELISGASLSILLTADTVFIQRLRMSLEEAGGRGVRVLVLAFEDLALENCENLKLTPGPKGAWQGRWIVMDVDGREHVVAHYETEDTLEHAIWCNDRCLSYWIHFGLLADFLLMHFFEETRVSGTCQAIRDELHRLYASYNTVLPGST